MIDQAFADLLGVVKSRSRRGYVFHGKTAEEVREQRAMGLRANVKPRAPGMDLSGYPNGTTISHMTKARALRKCMRCGHFCCPCCGDWCDHCFYDERMHHNKQCADELACVYDPNDKPPCNYWIERKRALQKGWKGDSESTMEDGRVMFLNVNWRHG